MTASKLGALPLALLCLLAGCGAALESSQVRSRFSTLFQCDASRTFREAGGYRVEGCGRVAYFRCFDTNSHHHHDHNLAGVIFEGLFSSDTCVLEHTTEAPRRALRERPAAVVAHKTRRGVAVRTQILLAGGSLQLLGRPLEHAEHALLTFHGRSRLGPAPCTAQLYHDGVSIPIEQIRRASEYDVQLLIRVAALRGVEHALRFAGEACGKAFALDEHARTTLALFETRFREELVRAHAQD